jgi:phosphoribosylamine--glycine ligase
MISPEGDPKVLEYNVRFGDPETQPILMRLKSSLPALCLAAVRGQLDRQQAAWDPRACLGVVMAAGGYPGAYQKGLLISGLDNAFPPHVKVFHAGTTLSEQGVVTSGGRVLCVCALGDNVTEAQSEAYRACQKIHWEGAFTRSDIGYRAIDREKDNEIA